VAEPREGFSSVSVRS